MWYTFFNKYFCEVNTMKLLEDKIREDGVAVNENILKVDSFIATNQIIC